MLNCGKAPDGNKDSSYLTMISQPGLMFGIINIVGRYIFIGCKGWAFIFMHFLAKTLPNNRFSLKNQGLAPPEKFWICN